MLRNTLPLQETHSSEKNERLWVTQWGCGREAVIFSHGSSNAREVLIAFRESLDYKILSVTRDSNGRFIIINTIIKRSPFILINYYASNDENEQIQVLNEVQEQLDLLDPDQDTQIILGGDFNVIFDTNLDRWGNPRLKLNSVTKLLSMIAENDMCNIYRVRFLFSKRYTWRQKSPLKQCRLDYFLISDQLQEQIKIIESIPSVQSNHSTLIMKNHSTLVMKIGGIRQEAKRPVILEV